MLYLFIFAGAILSILVYGVTLQGNFQTKRSRLKARSEGIIDKENLFYATFGCKKNWRERNGVMKNGKETVIFSSLVIKKKNRRGKK